MSASIFMTVAIAIERYIAVHYPLDYNQASHLHFDLVNLIRNCITSNSTRKSLSYRVTWAIWGLTLN